MNVVDSSGWIEYFADGPNADFFAPAIEATSELIVPAISVCEVFKRVLQQRSESEALQAVAVMMRGRGWIWMPSLPWPRPGSRRSIEFLWLTASAWQQLAFTALFSGRRISISSK